MFQTTKISLTFLNITNEWLGHLKHHCQGHFQEIILLSIYKM